MIYARFKADKDIMGALFGTPQEENGGGEPRGSNRRRDSLGNVAVGHPLRQRYRNCLAINRAAKEDDGRDLRRVRDVGPHRIGGQD